jgi:hypothetical protein
MPDFMPRLALTLAGIVAIVVLSLGIKDYVQQQNQPGPAAAPATPTVANAKTRTKSKRASTTRARLSASAANAPAPPAALDADKQLVHEAVALTGATTIALRDDAPNSSWTQSSYDIIEASDLNNRLRNELHMISSPASSACLPLPNLTGPGDVDAPYYDNWAGEYCDR